MNYTRGDTKQDISINSVLSICKNIRFRCSQQLWLLPVEISDQIWLLLFKDSEEDVFGCLTSSFQGAAEEFPHPLLSGRDSPDCIIVFLLDYTFPEEIIQYWSCIGHSCDQITLVFIHKVLHWERRGGETLSSG